MRTIISLINIALLASALLCNSASAQTPKPVRVFILAGQSNMEGHGFVAADPKRNGGKGSLEFVVKDPATAKSFSQLIDAQGHFRTRDDVFISYLDRKGALSVGYGADKDLIGPELGFGWVMGDALPEPVLLIKCAWGGKSLAVDFRPPSAGKPGYSLGTKADAEIAGDPSIVGKYYRETVSQTKAALAHIADLVPGSDGRYVLAGFAWHQGWNDRINEQFTAEYESNMAHFMRDMRKELDAPALPFVIAETGMGGPDEKNRRALALMKAQAAVAEGPEFKGNVAFVATRQFWRTPEQSPNSQIYHWNCNAETYYLIGATMGEAMKTLIATDAPRVQSSESRVQSGEHRVQPGEMAGYLLVPNERVPQSFNAGFSMYVAAWPLLQTYPGHRFQSGLFGTWMFAQYDGKAPEKLYSDIEGGLGWWRGTHFPTETPKFIMGGVAPNFIEWANGPGAGKGTDWNKPKGQYGVAQLSPWLLFPPDGLNLKQGAAGELVGYGYLPLPLATAKTTTAGKDIPTGDQCWTLFLNTANFKGPLAFFTPFFWSHAALDEPRLSGLLLDSRPSNPNRAVQMETQYIPAVLGTDKAGETYARIAPTNFPRQADGDSVLVHQITSYNKHALWDAVKTWFEGGNAATGAIDADASVVHTFSGKGGATWKIYADGAAKDQQLPLAWDTFATPRALDPHTFGYRWNDKIVSTDNAESGHLITLPQYFHLTRDPGKKPRWMPVRAEEVPAETGLASVHFDRPKEPREQAFVTPDDPQSCWKTPGPKAGPFTAHLGDGTVVTYYWYRFADQPALLNADLTDQEREAMQTRIEKLHRAWTKDREYLPPPTVGKLAEIDPALVVTPPKGLEVGYVPIATRQEIPERR